MALDGTYTGLKASVADWLNRGDLTAAVPDFIALAEADMVRRLVIGGAPREMMGRADASIDDEFELVPSDFMGARSFWLDGATLPLEFVEPEKIAERKTLYASQAGDPTVYAVVGYEFWFWPAPTAEIQAELTYLKRPTVLSADNSANWILTLHPDVYLFGALMQAAPYLKDDARVAVWGQKYLDGISSICEAGKRAQQAPQLALPINLAVT